MNTVTVTNKCDSFVKQVNNLVFENFRISEALLEFQNEDCQDESHADFLTFPLPDDAPWLSPAIKAAISSAKMLVDCLKESAVTSDIYVEDNQLNKVKTIVALTLNAMKKEFARDQYSKLLCTEEKLPLEILCYLQQKEVMPLQMYLQCNVAKSHVIAQFSKSVVQLFISPQSNEDVTRWMSIEIMFCLVNCMFSRSINDSGNDQLAIKKVCHAVVDSIIKNVIISSVMDVNITLNTRVNVIAVMMEDTRINSLALASFCSYLQKTVLTSNPTVKVSQALSEQHLWLYKLSSPFFISVLQKSLSSSELSEVISLLKSLVQHQEVNWKMLLVFISTCLACYQDAADQLSELVEGMLQQAFANLQLDSLITAFLIGRQICMECLPIQKSYSNWFQKCFGDSTTYTNSPKNFAFLVKFLTSLVPHEQAIFLKTHVLKPPHVVPRCRALWNDYLSLARTRLKDLKEPVEELGIYSTDGELVQKQGELHAETDVEKALQLFDASGKIPSTVFEASIFRKPYFNGRFLVALLKPRLLPDIPDVKMRFIEQLKQAGKIPMIVYEDYLRKCENEAEGFLEGVEMDDDLFEDAVIEPSADLKQALAFLCKQLAVPDQSEVGPAISQVSNKLQRLLQSLQDFPSPVMKQDYAISLDSMDLFKPQIEEVVNEIVELFCGGLPPRDSSWDVLFVSMLSCHQALHIPLVQHLWCTFTRQEEVDAGLVLLMHRIGSIFPKVERSGQKDSFPGLIFQALPVSSISEREHLLVMSAKYLQFALECETSLENISNAIITKFQFAFLTERKRMINSNYESLYKAVENIGPKLSVDEWLCFEKEVKPEMLLYDRMDTLRFWIYDYFLGDHEEDLSAVGFKLLYNFLDVPRNHSSSLFPLLTILQEILLHLKPNEVPFLLEYFDKNVLPNDGSNPILLQSQLETFFRLVTCLAPHLIFTNHPSHVTEESLARVSHILQHFAREYVTEGPFLSKFLTLHIWQGLLQLSSRHELIAQFLKETPVLRAATIVHYRSLYKQCSNISYLNALQKLFDKLDKMEFSLPSELEVWEVGLAISSGFPVTISSTTEVEGHILLIALIRGNEKFDYLNSICQQEYNKLISLLKMASLQAREKCCRPQLYLKLSTQIQKFLPTNCWQLYPSCLLQIMLKMWEEREVADTWWLTAILENYKQCKIQLAVDVEFIVAAGDRLKHMLRSSPSHILKNIPKELWEECDFTTQLNFLKT